jgi:cation diffusion facilitator family transporter
MKKQEAQNTFPGDGTAAKRKERVAFFSVLASGVLAIVKFAAGCLSGSLALLSESAHSLVDTGATIVTWLAVRWSGKPADEDHQYGHGKVESVAALVETGVLFTLALAVSVFAVRRLIYGGPAVDASAPVFAVVGFSVLVDVNRIRVLRKTARETGSMALAADALHFASDMAGSVAVLFGLLAARFLHFERGDALASFLVAAFIGVAGWRLGRQALNTLLDAAPEGRAAKLRSIAVEVPGVVAVDSVRTRSDGSRVFAEIFVAVSRAHSFDEVAIIAERLRKEVGVAFPDTELTLSTRAVALNTETVREQVLLAGMRFELPLHHVTVQDVAGRLSVSFDMEVDGQATLAEAHDRAERFKEALRSELGASAEVEPHIEPLDAAPLSGVDASPEVVAQVTEALQAGAQESADIRDVHDVRVRVTRAGWVVNYHCRAEGELRVELVHRQMDRIEHSVQTRCPEIVRIVGHSDAQPED